MKKEGRILGEFTGHNTGKYILNYRSKIDNGKLLSGYLKLTSEAFKPEAYFKRCITFLKDYKSAGVKSPGSIIENSIFFFRFLVKKNKSPYLKQFRKFLLRVLLTQPNKLKKAAELGFKGYQFYRMTLDEINLNKNIFILEEEWTSKSA